MIHFDILFSVMAMREVTFFSHVADILKDNGLRVGFINFFEPGDEYLQRKGYTVYSIHKSLKQNKDKGKSLSEDVVRRYEQKFGLPNMRELILHEKLTFNRYDDTRLLRKLLRYFDFFEQVFAQIKCNAVIQELGGFIAPLSLFHFCLSSNINHVGIEPAMFKGRLFFTLNGIYVDVNKTTEFRPEIVEIVNDYVRAYQRQKTVVIPKKDLHHFKDRTLGKLLNRENAVKLLRKLNNKYLKHQSEEYDAIGNHVLRNVKMYLNRKRLTRIYSMMNDSDKFVYYPFHVPLDFQLTVRSSEYLDQIGLLKYISNILPYGYFLYVKEHPAAIGAYSFREMKNLLINRNVKLLHPKINSYDIISQSRCVITINSKVGAEAIMQSKPVIVLGKAFYRNHGFTYDVGEISALRSVIKKALENGKPDSEVVRSFLVRTYSLSYPGELYVNNRDNVLSFGNSLKGFLNSALSESREDFKPAP